MILDGKIVAGVIKDNLKAEVSTLSEKPCLAVVLVGEDPASQVYVRNKERACEYIGIESAVHRLPVDVTQEFLESLIKDLNQCPLVHGILVQLPLPKHLDEKRVINLIDPKKDVDCFHPVNVGKLHLGEPDFLPCTPAGVIRILDHYGLEISGKECVVVGRSNIVGRPMAEMLLNRDATVTVAHSRTTNLKEVCSKADILICAIGKARFFDADYVKNGAVVIDVGMNRDEFGKLCGDVDFDEVDFFADYVTPVPGGCGVMTVAILMENCVKAYRIQTQAE